MECLGQFLELNVKIAYTYPTSSFKVRNKTVGVTCLRLEALLDLFVLPLAYVLCSGNSQMKDLQCSNS